MTEVRPPSDRPVLLVTGAGGGIGSETMTQLAARGVPVLGVDVDAEAARLVAERLQASGADVIGVGADISDESAVRSAIASAKERWGHLDGIFNNAGIEGRVAPIIDYPVEDFDRVLQVNVRGTWLVMKHAIPELCERNGGVILNMASTSGLTGTASLSAYIASKHAVIGLTRAIAIEYARQGIRVNALCPGATDTRMIQAIAETLIPGNTEAALRAQEAKIPSGSFASIQDVATFAVWLLLDAPHHLTGAVLPLDGGQTAGF